MRGRRFIVSLFVAGAFAVGVTSRGASGPIVITNQPQDVVICECRTATFTVGVEGTPPFAFQWYRSDEPSGGGTNPISGATQQTYTSPHLQRVYSGARFSVVVTNAFGSTTSRWATVVIADCPMPPRLLVAAGQADPTRILLTFDANCSLDAGSVQEPANYRVSGGINITEAQLHGESNVLLTTDAPLASGATYTVTVNDVSDVMGNVIEPDSHVSFRAPVRLDFHRASEGVIFSWPTVGILQESTNLSGSWMDRSNVPNPLVISNGPTRFFRVRVVP